ncbi:MAG: TIR domain-containing protein [Alphaproteobacteria bacterium]|nr:TIR domain-containing protein [Alphaproteobacteria bacterium]
MKPPKVFVSYSHDSQAHRDWVVRLAADLRSNGVETILDQWDLSLGQDVSLFMQKGIAESDRVLLVCTETYVRKAEDGIGGVGYERLVVTAEVVQSIDTKKFIPVVRGNSSARKVPLFLGPRLYVDFSDDKNYETRLQELLRELHGAAAKEKPPIGPNPFSGRVAALSAPRVVSRTGATGTGASLLDSDWFAKELVNARKGADAIGFATHMELRFGLHDAIQKSQIELLDSVRAAEIHTFGWPIGVTLENRDEYKPRPFGDGVKAEISIKKASPGDRESYDYWAIAQNGDFFLLQSLFEDQRKKNEVFFNTRIVRVTESLLFAARLYRNLGAPEGAPLSIRVTHRGFAGRTLSSSNGNRQLSVRATSNENECQSELVLTLKDIEKFLVADVKRLTAPLFTLFDFTTFADTVYEDIVRRFERGEVT